MCVCVCMCVCVASCGSGDLLGTIRFKVLHAWTYHFGIIFQIQLQFSGVCDRDPGFPLENTNPPPRPENPRKLLENYNLAHPGPVLKITEKLLRSVTF